MSKHTSHCNSSCIVNNLLNNKYDQFREGEESEPEHHKSQRCDGTVKRRSIDKKEKAIKKWFPNPARLRRYKKEEVGSVVIELSSESENDSGKNYCRAAQVNDVNIEKKDLIQIVDLDQEEIEYYKSKLNLITRDADLFARIQKAQVTKFSPPVDVEKVPKFIYEYPPYPLGPTDTWPPKYPNSWKSFKMEMREIRKLN